MTRRERRRLRALEIARATKRLRSLYADASAETVQAGRDWYPAAFETARELAPDAPHIAAGVIAALSPQTRWRENVRAARAIMRDPYLAYANGTNGLPGYRQNHRKAAAIARGAPCGQGPGDGLGQAAPKVRAFFAAICGDLGSITLDVWAMRAAFPHASARPPSGDAYARGVAAYTAAARACGEHPRDFQAIIWLHARGAREHLRDRMAAAQLAFELVPACWHGGRPCDDSHEQTFVPISTSPCDDQHEPTLCASAQGREDFARGRAAPELSAKILRARAGFPSGATCRMPA